MNDGWLDKWNPRGFSGATRIHLISRSNKAQVSPPKSSRELLSIANFPPTSLLAPSIPNTPNAYSQYLSVPLTSTTTYF